MSTGVRRGPVRVGRDPDLSPVLSEHSSPTSDEMGVLESSVLNAEALWRAFAAARGHRIIDEPDWLAVDAGKGAGGHRVILRRAVTGAAQRAALNQLIEGASRAVVVEDPSRASTCTPKASPPRTLPVMAAGPFTREATPPGAVPTPEQPGITVRRVEGNQELLLEADRIVVQGFPLTSWQPYRPARRRHLLGRSDARASARGHRTGADAGGHAGTGRVADGSMRHIAGAPLYRKLGFETALETTRWRASNPA